MALEEEAVVQEETLPSVRPQIGGEEQELALQQEMLDNDKKLSYMQRYYPNAKSLEIPKEAESDFWFGFDKSESLTNNAALYLEATYPVLGEMISGESADETYGEGFSDLALEDRRKILLKYRQDQLIKEYPILSQLPQDEQSLSTGVGGLIGLIADPTTLIPVGTGARTLSLVSGAIGLGYSLADQLANKGKVDGGEALQMTALSAAGGLAVGKGMQVLSNKMKVAQASKHTATVTKEAGDKIDEINLVLTKAAAEGMDINQANKLVLSELNITQDDLIKILASTDRKPVFPSQQGAQVALNAATKGTTEAARVTNPTWDRILGSLTTRIGKISEPIKLSLRNFERKVHETRVNTLKEFKPLMAIVKRVPEVERAMLNTHLMNGNFDAAKAILRNTNTGRFGLGGKAGAAADDALTKTVDELDRLFKLQYPSGKMKFGLKKLANYFPRSVKDFDGLKQAMGKNKQVNGVYEKALKDYAKTAGVKVSALTQKQQESVIARVTAGFNSKILKNNKLSWNKERKIPELTEDLAKYYDDPVTSLFKHANSSADDIHKRQFFGKNLVSTKAGDDIDLTESISSLIGRELKDLDSSQQSLLQGMLSSRFGAGEIAPHKALRLVRDVGYGTTLANPISALVQLGDVGLSMFTQGIMPTVKAILGKSEITMQSLGLDNLMASEFTNVIDASKALHNVMTWGGFRHIDRFGKNVLLNAAYKNGKNLAKTAEGKAKLAKGYKKAFGESEFQGLVDDLAAGTMSERVKLMLWSELSDTQPIALSEMPQKFLDMPNGRILYSLKSYAIKQLDIIRRKIVDEYKTGSKTEATKQLARYIAIIPIVGGTVEETKDLMLGRGFNSSEIIGTNSPEVLFKLLGLNKYLRDRSLYKGNIVEVIQSTLTPPLGYLDSVAKDLTDLTTSGDVLPERTLKELPVGGKIWYNFFGGGLEKFEDRQSKERKAERKFE